MRPVRLQPRQSATRNLALCGIAGPIIYAAVVIVLGCIQDGYSPARDSMSKLGAVDAPYNLVMNTLGLPLLGLSVVALAAGLHRGMAGVPGCPGLGRRCWLPQVLRW